MSWVGWGAGPSLPSYKGINTLETFLLRGLIEQGTYSSDQKLLTHRLADPLQASGSSPGRIERPTAGFGVGKPTAGARRIKKLRLRLSATVGFIGQCRLGSAQRFVLFNVLALPSGAIISLPDHFRECPAGATLIVSLHKFPLLLVVYCSAADFFALSIRPARGDRASFAVSGQDDAGSGGNFAILLLSGCQRMVIDLLY